MEDRKLVYDYSREDLTPLFQEWNEPPYRVKQLWEGLYRHLWEDINDFTPFSIELRDRISQDFTFQAIHPVREIVSPDGETHKTLFYTRSGNPLETVLMHYKNRHTLCISSQSGCGMGCIFCATGQMGFKANLSCGEMIAQVLYYNRILAQDGQKLTNIVIMGMGEPLNNFDQTIKAIDFLNDPQGLNMGERRFTISTVGLVPQLNRFSEMNRQINLAISLHAADDDLRSKIIPINRKYPLSELMAACRKYSKVTHRRITFEWALIRDFNDDLGQAQKLVNLLKGLIAHVNLIPLNPTVLFPGKPPRSERITQFQQYLIKNHIPCTIRLRRGIDIQAGCGQLATKNLSEQNKLC